MGEPEDGAEDREDMEEINRFNKFVSKVINSLAKTLSDAGIAGQPPQGFEVRIGKNSVPIMESVPNEFADRAAGQMQSEKPLVDVIDEDDKVHVVTELKGVGKGSIRVTAKPEEVNISVIDSEHTCNRTISMPCMVDPERSEARFNNGVLEILLKKVRSGSAKAIEVK